MTAHTYRLAQPVRSVAPLIDCAAHLRPGRAYPPCLTACAECCSLGDRAVTRALPSDAIARIVGKYPYGIFPTPEACGASGESLRRPKAPSLREKPVADLGSLPPTENSGAVVVSRPPADRHGRPPIGVGGWVCSELSGDAAGSLRVSCAPPATAVLSRSVSAGRNGSSKAAVGFPDLRCLQFASQSRSGSSSFPSEKYARKEGSPWLREQ
jgi:hypothetical protein